MEARTSHFTRDARDKSDGKERNQRAAQRPKRKGAKNICTANSSKKAGERLPLIGSLVTRTTEKSDIPTLAGKRKCAQLPLSAAMQDSFMTPWEVSSNSVSSFTSILPVPPLHYPPFPRSPSPITLSKIFPNPPQPIRDNKLPASQKRVKKLASLRGSTRAPCLPPLRQVSNLSFTRSFTFSFFELPWHQSMHNRPDRLKELVGLLRKIQY